MVVKMNLRIITKNHAANSEKNVFRKIDFKAVEPCNGLADSVGPNERYILQNVIFFKPYIRKLLRNQLQILNTSRRNAFKIIKQLLLKGLKTF